MEMFVSVIVPVYKVEQYLDICVRSILNQTYQNYELLLVDDGSPDNCPALCDKYAEQYKNIRVIHKENGGLSDARNVGVKLARGNYVTFIDSDDYIHPLYLELLVTALKKTDATFSVCEIKSVFDANRIEKIDKTKVLIKKYNSKDALCDVLYQKFHGSSASGILLPLGLAKKYPFPKGKRLEDLATTYKYYFPESTVAFVYSSLYYYFQRGNSIMHNTDDGIFLDWIDAINQIVKDCTPFEKSIQKAARNVRFSNSRMFLLSLDGFKNRQGEAYKKFLANINKDKWIVLFDENAKYNGRLAALMFLFGKAGIRLFYKLKELKKLITKHNLHIL